MSISQDVRETLAQVEASKTTIRRADFETGATTADDRTKLAEYEAETPIVVRQDKSMRLAFTTVHVEEHGGSGVETFELDHDLMETENTRDVLAYVDGEKTTPESIDYDDNEVELDHDETADVEIFYVPGDAVEISVEISAPRSQGSVSRVIYDDVTKLLHARNQNREPPRVEGDDALDFVVPRKWTLEVYADGSVPLTFGDVDDFGEDSDTVEQTARNGLLSIPVRKSTEDVPGLGQAIKRHFIG